MNTAKAKKKDQATTTKLTDPTLAISRVRVVETRNHTDMILFTLTVNGVDIHSCRIAEGKNGDFLSFPQYRGGDGKYYSHAFAPLTDEDAEKIIEMVQVELDK